MNYGSRIENKTKLAVIRIFGIIVTIVVSYLYFNGSQLGKLAGYLLYMSIACTIVPLPTPPYVIGMGKMFDPWLVALLGALGNTIASLGEYYLLTWLFSKTELQEKIEASRLFQRLTTVFSRSAFFILTFTSLWPLPLDPFYLTAIVIRYPLHKYLAAISTGKWVRYYLLAQVGESFQIPNKYLVTLLILLISIPFLVGLFIKLIRALRYVPQKSN
ncbi:MAG: VTT domain-containing protein [candidate division KSB1 bacterium]|nr:VTT domain-containing protein [candidate division KSB1 bacterium]MDZ7333627.1 VTT domain-containing protein [candidate division KSB1 bacterium]MDZ7357813.1 VTT domain-containing protein [candidate division KSB1 bacterium]MDZ7377440.1 VTT domain-containing protein [candidate division KSB1 bacterium]MDZ7398741.1 VTT domain-containing protein [candidate division KSB1 bacterium]